MERTVLFQVTQEDKRRVARATHKEDLSGGLLLHSFVGVNAARTNYWRSPDGRRQEAYPATIFTLQVEQTLYHYGRLVENREERITPKSDRWTKKAMSVINPLSVGSLEIRMSILDAGKELVDFPELDTRVRAYLKVWDKDPSIPELDHIPMHFPKFLRIEFKDKDAQNKNAPELSETPP